MYTVVERRLARKNVSSWTEEALRKELAGCILGSGVRYESAKRAVDNLDAEGIFGDYWLSADATDFRVTVEQILSGKAQRGPASRSYRFVHSRAAQLTGARAETICKSLSDYFSSTPSVRDLRKLFVDTFMGLGPIQASMLLRNVGAADDIAILDTHILEYLRMKGLRAESSAPLQTLAAYERVERVLLKQANKLNYRPSSFDSAVWLTFKALREIDA
jgi:N-glycosylase/DNA lyase